MPVKSSNALRIVAAAALLAAIIAGATFLPLQQYLLWLLQHIEHLGAWGPVLLVGVYVAVCSLMLPSWFITLAAGFLFNVPSELASSAVRQMLGMVP